METFRDRAWAEIGELERRLGPVARRGVELRRRQTIWAEIDGHDREDLKERQFAELEAATRAERELLDYALASPPMRDLLVAAAAEGAEPLDLPPAPQAFYDWRSRALYQVYMLEEVLGGPDDPEARRRSALWVAIDRFDWPQTKELQFAKLEAATRGEVELLGAMFAADGDAKDAILTADVETHDEGDEEAGTGAPEAPAPAPAPTTAPPPQGPAVPAPAAAAKPASGPVKPLPAAKRPDPTPPPPPGPPRPPPPPTYRGPSAQQLYKEGTAAWNEYAANEFRKKSVAREAARKLHEIFRLLEKNPDGASQLQALEKVVGLSWKDIMDHELERRAK